MTSANARPGLRVLVVDDERPARAKVRRFLERDPEVELVFEAPDGVRALEVIRDQAPDIAFLDVQMPGLDGFQLVERLPPEALPHLVFVTAFDEYAVRAFEVNAVDYLLKPFDGERFARALARAKEVVEQRRGREEANRLLQVLRQLRREEAPRLDRLLVEAEGRSVLLRLEEIDRIEADRNYVRIHARSGAYRLRTAIAALERRLDPARFVRINRSEIVNADRIRELEPAGHGDLTVRLAGGYRTRLSRRYRDRLESFTTGA
jgi:two-component system LytT family response regulator